jgi:hypothetical protein
VSEIIGGKAELIKYFYNWGFLGQPVSYNILFVNSGCIVHSAIHGWVEAVVDLM